METINQIAPFLEAYRSWGYAFIFLSALVETLPFVGLIIPGVILVGLFGVLSAKGYFDPVWLIIFSSAGAIIGDNIGYWLGTKGAGFFRNENKLLKASHLEKAEEFFRKHGGKSVVLGRFIGPLRPIIPFVAGLSRMNIKTFMLWNAAGAILWSVFLILLGYFFGKAFIVIVGWWAEGGTTVISLLILAAVAFLIVRHLKKRS